MQTTTPYELVARKQIIENIKAHMHGMSQADLSKLSGLSISTMKKWFSYSATPHTHSLKKVAKALHTTLPELDPRQTYKVKHPTTSINRDIFTKEFNKLVKSSGLKPSTLARKMGVNPTSVFKWLNGEWQPQIATVARIAAYFNVPQSKLGAITPETTIQTSTEFPDLNPNALKVVERLKFDLTQAESNQIINYIQYIKSQRNNDWNK